MDAGQSTTLTVGDETISFTVERTARRKTVALSFGADGLRVLAPCDMPDADILPIIRRKLPWILEKKARFEETGTLHGKHEFVNGESFRYLGRHYRLMIQPDDSIFSTQVSLKGAYFIAPVTAGLSPELTRLSVRSGLKRWYRKQAQAKLPERVGIYSAKLGIAPPKLLIREQEKRWASCDKAGAIRFNWLLIMAPLDLIDYVVAHELCHLQELNHSARFWRLLETIMPDFQAKRQELTESGGDFYF